MYMVLSWRLYVFFFKGDGDHRDLHVLTHSFPTRRSADLRRRHWRSYHGLRRGIEEDLAFAEDLCSRTNTVACHQRRSEEHTSELQSLMRISSAVFCFQQTTNNITTQTSAQSLLILQANAKTHTHASTLYND